MRKECLEVLVRAVRVAADGVGAAIWFQVSSHRTAEEWIVLVPPFLPSSAGIANDPLPVLASWPDLRHRRQQFETSTVMNHGLKAMPKHGVEM